MPNFNSIYFYIPAYDTCWGGWGDLTIIIRLISVQLKLEFSTETELGNIGKLFGKNWQILANIGQILGKYWANIGQILGKY